MWGLFFFFKISSEKERAQQGAQQTEGETVSLLTKEPDVVFDPNTLAS